MDKVYTGLFIYLFIFNLDRPSEAVQKDTNQQADSSRIMNTSEETASFSSEKDSELPQMDKYRGMSGILSKIMHNIVDKKKKVSLF